MNDMLYFPSVHVGIEAIAELALRLDYTYIKLSHDTGRIMIQFYGTDNMSDVTYWKGLPWNPQDWESEIRDTLIHYRMEPSVVFLVEFASYNMMEMTGFLKQVLDKYAGIIYPSVVDEFVLHKDNLTLDNMNLLYDRDYPEDEL